MLKFHQSSTAVLNIVTIFIWDWQCWDMILIIIEHCDNIDCLLGNRLNCIYIIGTLLLLFGICIFRSTQCHSDPNDSISTDHLVKTDLRDEIVYYQPHNVITQQTLIVIMQSKQQVKDWNDFGSSLFFVDASYSDLCIQTHTHTCMYACTCTHI
jgi:hypothetical protein